MLAESIQVITFPENTGERDQAWTDIANTIEKFAKDLRSFEEKCLINFVAIEFTQ